MPLIRVELLAGRSAQQKRELAVALTEACCKSLGVPPDAVDVMFFDVQRQDWATAGVPWADRTPAPPPPQS